MEYLKNIDNNFTFLKQDFVGFSINFIGIVQFIGHVSIALGLIILFYCFGEKIRKLFFSEHKYFTSFVNIALGYIFMGTGLGILGLFSLLRPQIVFLYLVLIASITFHDLSKKQVQNLIKITKRVRQNVKSFTVWGVGLFVLIAFLRLMAPELVEDGYHSDNAKLFVAHQTTMIASKEALHTIPFPQLPEMIYTFPLFFGDNEANRFIHFGFYVLIIALLFSFARKKQYYFASFLPLLFVTTPVVIRNSPTQYTDFFAIFCFLLAIFIVEKKMSKKTIFLTGLLFGAVVSAKVWMLVYLPALLLYILFLNNDKKKILRRFSLKKLIMAVLIFFIGYFFVCGVWYIRAYLLTGNPAFPILNATIIPSDPSTINPFTSDATHNYFGFNTGMFKFENLVGLSPFFFLAILSFVFISWKKLSLLSYVPLFALLIIFTVEQLFIKIEWGRYLIMWSLITGAFVTYGTVIFYEKIKLYRYGVLIMFAFIFSYYFLNTLFMLPYGWGWADKNVYLTRILSRDNASYYDFDRLFNKHITEKDIVGTYGYVSFYYANFHHIDVGYLLNKKGDSLMKLPEQGVKKLAIMGGDIVWFCKQLSLKDCDVSKVKLLATYPDYRKYNLYEIK